jgi:dihydroorotase
MKVLLKQVSIISPSSPFNGQTKDILINNGTIDSIGDDIKEKADRTIDQPGLCVSPGWMDVFADLGEPGFEYRETIVSGTNAAAAGGFTDLLVIPNTQPVVHSKSQVEYIIGRSADTAVSLHPIGAVTKNTEGTALSEMYDMRQSGAPAFGDGTRPIQSPGIMLKALQYVKAFDGTIIQVPDDNSIGSGGLMNEGITSTQLGLPGKPAIAEELMVARDIELVRYTASAIHFTGVSTQKSIELITAAKAEGLKVSCSVTPYHCCFCDEDLADYDTNLKVDPPLRSRADMMAIRKAVIDGQVDCIASHHLPQNADNKICEFEYAKHGMIGLETLFAVMNTIGCSPERFVQMQAINGRRTFGMDIPVIREGEKACLTLFDPSSEFVYHEGSIRSASKNSPFIGRPMKGKVAGIINRNKIVLNQA